MTHNLSMIMIIFGVPCSSLSPIGTDDNNTSCHLLGDVLMPGTMLGAFEAQLRQLSEVSQVLHHHLHHTH